MRLTTPLQSANSLRHQCNCETYYGAKEFLTERSSLPKARLMTNQPGDRYEQEADHIADVVVNRPATAISNQTEVRNSQEKTLQTKLASGPSPKGQIVKPMLSNQIHTRRGRGQSLDLVTRAFVEPRLGHDISQVRVHADEQSAEMTQAISAKAITLGQDIFFGKNQFNPNTMQGRRLLVHELTHTLQQSGGSQAVQHQMPPNTLAGNWIVDDRDTIAQVANDEGKTETEVRDEDADLMEDTFQEVCDLAELDTSPSPYEIKFQSTSTPRSSLSRGCQCMLLIEDDLNSGGKISGTPHISFMDHGWSHGSINASPPFVKLRYPETVFQSGYWTESQDRAMKDLWQLLAHEICGHFYAFVKDDDPGQRGVSPEGHNLAIQYENWVAEEKVGSSYQPRGLDYDAATQTPLAGHRGESFIQAEITDFEFDSDDLPAGAQEVIQETARTIEVMAPILPAQKLYIQIEGFAYQDEYYKTAIRRAKKVKRHIRRKLSDYVDSGRLEKKNYEFGNFIKTKIYLDAPTTTGSDPDMKVRVYLYHQEWSEG